MPRLSDEGLPWPAPGQCSRWHRMQRTIHWSAEPPGSPPAWCTGSVQLIACCFRFQGSCSHLADYTISVQIRKTSAFSMRRSVIPTHGKHRPHRRRSTPHRSHLPVSRPGHPMLWRVQDASLMMMLPAAAIYLSRCAKRFSHPLCLLSLQSSWFGTHLTKIHVSMRFTSKQFWSNTTFHISKLLLRIGWIMITHVA